MMWSVSAVRNPPSRPLCFTHAQVRAAEQFEGMRLLGRFIRLDASVGPGRRPRGRA